MKHYPILFLNLSIIVLISIISSAAIADDSYLLHPGDAVQVSVWGEDNLNSELLVLPDGSITFPLVGRVMVRGKYSTEVEDVISSRLARFIPEAEVTVVVTSIDGNSIFILGKVNNPGKVVMTGPMTVMQALSVAGGLDRFADKDAIKVLRNEAKGKQRALQVDYDDLVAGKNLETNFQLQAGDTVLVP
jgi:polysaccharide export outer membrane protein